MRALIGFWDWLTRPRGVVPHRFTGVGRARGSKRGVALLMVITTIAFMTVLVTEINYSSRVRLLMSAHARDEVVAEALAESGVGLYRLILMADKEISSQISQFMPDVPLVSLWEMIPMINTGLMRMLFVSSGSVDGDEMEAFAATGQVSEEVAQESREAGGHFSNKTFLDFEGDFFAEITDEDARINVNDLCSTKAAQAGCTYAELREDPVALMMFGLMSGEENDQWLYDRDIDPWELIGNLADWIDKDTTRATPQGGYEDNLYNGLENPYLSKNAKFNTLDEIREVEGWQGEVWDRFGKDLTIYETKININTASPELKCALFDALTVGTLSDADCQILLQEFETQKLTTGNMTSGKDVKVFLEGQGRSLDEEREKIILDRISAKSQVFRVTSTGVVGDTTATITCIYDFSRGSRGRIRYWRMD